MKQLPSLAVSEKAIFLKAIDLDDSGQRRAYVADVCGDDTELYHRVAVLLAAHDEPAHVLDRPLIELPTLDSAQPIGSTIGPYRLMEQIGEGGFGLVFVAQQEQQVRRKVALKIIKPGMGTKEVLARFEAERQAVAMMNHPNIAQIFDAGVTADGRPYFVMELVRGVPMTEFADAHRMSIDERLEMFMSVCTAVQHAHHKGVIHRDLKPSNVMATLHDDRPVVKVIDFGVAKAVGQSLTDKTIYTRFFSLIGTPLYMSPEQAEMSGLDVDTRSDIYSLGVLLYELLVGETPLDRARLDSAGLDEMRRIIREEEPPRPSQRLTTITAQETTISGVRRVEPKRLMSRLRGDLDWIVMKALEKDRDRRYESAAAMASDIDRHRREQPILARPPSRSYLLLKFARRQRVALITFSLVALAMFIGTGVSIWQRNQAIRERDLKEQALREATAARREVEQFAAIVTIANSLVASAQTHADAGRWKDAKADFDRAVQQQPNYYLPWVSRAQFYVRLNLWDESAQDYAKAISLGASADAPQWWGVAALFALTRNDDASRTLFDQFERGIEAEQPIESWDFLRNCAAVDGLLSDDSRQFLVRWTETLQRPDHRPPHDDNRPPPHDRHPPLLGFLAPGEPPPPPPQQSNHNSRGPMGGPVFHELPRNIRDYITGLTLLRAGDDASAIERLRHAAQDPRWPARGLVNSPLAIALYRSERIDEARQALARADESLMEFRGVFSDGSAHVAPWFDLVEMLAFRQEATVLITGKPATEPDFVHKIHQRSLEKLQ